MTTSFPVPTRFGWVYLAFCLLTLVGCINYQLSLGYLLCFLLFSVWIGAWVEAARQFQGLQVQHQSSHQVFAGQEVLVQLQIQRPEQHRGLRVLLKVDPQEQTIDLLGQTHGTGELLLHTTRRGWMDLPAFQMQSFDLLGLFRVTKRWPGVPHAVLVYPALEVAWVPFPISRSGEGSSRPSAGQDEYRGLRSYQRGDSLSRVAWKRGELPDGSLLTKEFEGQQGQVLSFDFQNTGGLSLEHKLSRLATWVVQAQKNKQTFQLLLPGFEATGSGERHVQMCLTRLAEFQEQQP